MNFIVEPENDILFAKGCGTRCNNNCFECEFGCFCFK